MGAENAYVAPIYPSEGPISDSRLVDLVGGLRPKFVFIALSGGVQERLGWDLRQKLGYRPDKRLAVTVSTRNLPPYRDPAVILIDQLKEIYIDGVLEPVDTAQWYPRITRKDFTVGLNVTESGVDDPDQQFYENYVCGSERNYTGYCNPEVDKLVDRQSMESDKEKRKQLVWEIERRLAEDNARPVIFYPRGATCRHPQVKGLTVMVNSIYNGYRYEDLWLDN